MATKFKYFSFEKPLAVGVKGTVKTPKSILDVDVDHSDDGFFLNVRSDDNSRVITDFGWDDEEFRRIFEFAESGAFPYCDSLFELEKVIECIELPQPKHHLGDYVTIKSEYNNPGDRECDYPAGFTGKMLKDYGGKSFKITRVLYADEYTTSKYYDGDPYEYRLNTLLNFSWSSSMFQDTSKPEFKYFHFDGPLVPKTTGSVTYKGKTIKFHIESQYFLVSETGDNSDIYTLFGWTRESLYDTLISKGIIPEDKCHIFPVTPTINKLLQICHIIEQGSSPVRESKPVKKSKTISKSFKITVKQPSFKLNFKL